jgi:hypothetical protein
MKFVLDNSQPSWIHPNQLLPYNLAANVFTKIDIVIGLLPNCLSHCVYRNAVASISGDVIPLHTTKELWSDVGFFNFFSG